MSDKDVKIRLEADASGVKRGAEEAGRAIDDLNGKVNGLPPAYNRTADATAALTQRGAALSSVIGLVGVGVAAAGAAALAYGAHMVMAGISTAKLANELAGLSSKTGLSVEHLSSMRFVLEQNNATLNDYAGGMKILSSRIYDAANGNKSALATFQALGLGQQYLRDNIHNGDAVFAKLADRFAEMKDGAGKNALANDVLGGTYQALLPTLNSGAEGIRQLADEGDKWGKISAEMADKSRQLNDNWGALKFQAQGVGVNVANYFLPALVDITREMRAAANESGLLTGLITGLGVAFGKVFGLKSTRQELADDRAGDLFKQVGEAQTALNKLASLKGTSTGKDPDWLAGEIDKAATRVANLKKELKETVGERDRLLDKPAAPKIDAQDKPGKTGKEIDQYHKNLTSLLNTLENRADTVNEKFRSDLALLEKAYSSGEIGLDRYRSAVESLIGKTEFAKNLSREAAEAAKFQAEGVKRLAQEEEKRNKELEKSVAQDQRALDTMTRKNDLLEMGIESVTEMAVAELEAELASLDYADATIEVVKALEDRLEIARKVEAQARRGEHIKSLKDEAKEAQKAYEKTSEEINRGLTDALMRGFESGKDFASNFKDTLVNMFKTLVLRPIISAVLSPISGAVTGGLGMMGLSGQAVGGSALGMAQTGMQGYSLMSGLSSGQGIMGGIGSSVFGSSTAYGLGVSGLTMGGEQAAMLAAQTGSFGASGLSATASAGGGAMGSIGAALPYIGLAVGAIALISSLIQDKGGPKTEGNAFGTLGADGSMDFTPNTAVSAPYGDGDWGRAGSNAAQVEKVLAPVGKSLSDYVTRLGGNTSGLGLHLGYNTDPEGTAPDNVASTLLGKDGQELYRHVYDVEAGKGAEAMAAEINKMTLAAVQAVDISPILDPLLDSISDIGNMSEEAVQQTLASLESVSKVSAASFERTFGEAFDVEKIKGLAQSGENLLQTFSRLQSEFEATNYIVEMMGKDVTTAFGAIGLASEEARAALIGAAGGLGALSAKTGFFFENFYTETERTKVTMKGYEATLSEGFASLGVSVPTTTQQFRELVEAQDLSSDAGRSAYLRLLDLSDEFYALAKAGGSAAMGIQAIIAAANSVGTGTYGSYTVAQANSGEASYSVTDGFMGIPDVHTATGVDLTRFQTTLPDGYSPSNITNALNTLGMAPSSSIGDLISRNSAINFLAGAGVTDGQGAILKTALRGYASGGYASPGLAMVGEEGPELVDFAQPARVYTAQQTRAALSGSDEQAVSELRQLRADINAAMYAIAKNTMDTAKILRIWDGDGQPEVRPA